MGVISSDVPAAVVGKAAAVTFVLGINPVTGSPVTELPSVYQLVTAPVSGLVHGTAFGSIVGKAAAAAVLLGSEVVVATGAA